MMYYEIKLVLEIVERWFSEMAIDIAEVRNNIKKNISLLREVNGLKMREVANALGIKENTYRTWEDTRTVSSPKPDKLIALSRLYDVSVDFLMKNENENINSKVAVQQADADKVYGDKYLNELSAEEKMTVMKLRMLNSRDRVKVEEFIESITKDNQ